MVDRAELLGGLGGRVEHFEGADRGKIAHQAELLLIVGVHGCAHGHDDVLEVDLGLDGAGGADAHDVADVVGVVELVGIDADGGHAHAGGHDGHPDALVGAGVALDAADIVDEDGILEEVVCDVLRAQRIARHKDGLAEVFGLCLDMRSRVVHRGRSFRYIIIELFNYYFNACAA